MRADEADARAGALGSRQLLPKSDLETAQVNVRSTDAQIRSSEAQVTQAQASLNQNEVNLQHTVIEAPIDGLVISRNVDVGQTVAASMQAPTLFVLAADLTKMQVVANLDESDVGRIRPGQHVTFRVDAYPAETSTGTVSQVRLQPIVQQNVVTYATVIDVPNPELKLKPGMTANVNIEIAHQRAARAERGAAVPADQRDIRGAGPDAARPGGARARLGGGHARRRRQRRGAADQQAVAAAEPPRPLAPAAARRPGATGHWPRRRASGSDARHRRRGGRSATCDPAPAGGGDRAAEERRRMRRWQAWRRRLRAAARRRRVRRANAGHVARTARADAPARCAARRRGGGGAARAPRTAPAVHAAPTPAAMPPRQSRGDDNRRAVRSLCRAVESVGRVWLYIDNQLQAGSRAHRRQRRAERANCSRATCRKAPSS